LMNCEVARRRKGSSAEKEWHGKIGGLHNSGRLIVWESGKVIQGGHVPFRSQSPEPASGKPPQQNLRRHFNDIPSRDETLAIKRSTTTLFSHQKNRAIDVAWYSE